MEVERRVALSETLLEITICFVEIKDIINVSINLPLFEKDSDELEYAEKLMI